VLIAVTAVTWWRAVLIARARPCSKTQASTQCRGILPPHVQLTLIILNFKNSQKTENLKPLNCSKLYVFIWHIYSTTCFCLLR
jgi:hypothetical protein